MRRDRASSSPRFAWPLSCAIALAQWAAWPTASASDRGGARASSAVYDIAAGPLDRALNSFIAQSNVQLLYSPILVRGKRSSGLNGRYAPAQALARLLDEQSLTAVSVTPNTYLLQPVPARPRRGPRGADHPPAHSASRPASAAPTQLASVTVVGSRIPRDAFDTSVPVSVITSEQIEDSGVGTLYELLREQPGILGHNSISVLTEGRSSGFQPLVTAASASLYSLGPRGTLFLIDGRRVASNGLIPADLGGLFDLNGVPLSFIDRIEILRGSASANYGGDAAAGAINIVLKKDVQSTDLVVRYGVSERGDAQTSAVSASYGTRTLAGGNLFISADRLDRAELSGDSRRWHTADQTRFGLSDGREPIGVVAQDRQTLFPLRQCKSAGSDPDLPYCSFDPARYRTLLPKIRVDAAYAHWQQPVGDSASLEASVRHSQVEQTTQVPPEIVALYVTSRHPLYAQIIDDVPAGYAPAYVVYPFYDIGPITNRTTSRTLDLAVGARGTAGSWNWKLDLSRSTQETDANVSDLLRNSALYPPALRRYRLFSRNDPAVLNAMRATIRPSGRDTLDSLEASIDGVVFPAPGGPARFNSGIALRKERMIERVDPLQTQIGLYADTVSLVSRDKSLHSTSAFAELRVPVRHDLEIDLAANQDRDNKFSAPASSYRVGLAWAPKESVRLRASFGRTERPPTLQERRISAEGSASQLNVWAEPILRPCLELQPGFCRVTTGAGDNPSLRPESSRSASIGITLAPMPGLDVRIEHYRIARWDEFNASKAIFYPWLYPEGLVRNADGVLYRINDYVANTGRSDSRGWDLSANYLLRSRNSGNFDFHLGGHYLEHYATSNINPVLIGDKQYAAPKLSLLGSVKWRYGDWTTTLAMRHFGRSRAYPDNKSCPAEQRAADKCSNPSVTLLNLNLSYSGFERWLFSLNINNLADREPVNYELDKDGYNVAMDDPYGRYYVLTTTYRF
ncbi:TonB-dependent receptor [Lysobacter enzymogenes]|uniref:TonB-dependent receptor n=1 Tax=Lysobacter enzymogenes TaxID=69 RepID=UPI00099DE350|nr:TonB-dependent receptor [Lysobacter enzymogenes]UZW62191.1 TonB-dependent receptor [Lysobacter enzymogenes]